MGTRDDVKGLRELADMVQMSEPQRDALQRIAYNLESDAKRYEESEKLQDIGRSAYESIAEMVAALECDYERRDELKAMEEFTPEETEELLDLDKQAGDCESREDAEQRINEDPLSIEIHGKWTFDTVSDGVVKLTDAHDLKAEIMLSTGGPATRIMCELDEHMQPTRAWIQAQDWFQPWTDYVPRGDGETGETLLTYCRCFYFGLLLP